MAQTQMKNNRRVSMDVVCSKKRVDWVWCWAKMISATLYNPAWIRWRGLFGFYSRWPLRHWQTLPFLVWTSSPSREKRNVSVQQSIMRRKYCRLNINLLAFLCVFGSGLLCWTFILELSSASSLFPCRLSLTRSFLSPYSPYNCGGKANDGTAVGIPFPIGPSLSTFQVSQLICHNIVADDRTFLSLSLVTCDRPQSRSRLADPTAP
jgi:hypothetical protein